MNKTKVISYCGLDCQACDAFVATKNKDNQLKTQVAQRWSRIYSRTVTADDVFCKGCKSKGTQGIYCQTMCPVKPCCREKCIENCTGCDAFPCKDLKEVFAFCPEAGVRLRKLRT
ncbi:MAG: DUF3795 domain-containing protein [Desulfobacter sp.]